MRKDQEEEIYFTQEFRHKWVAFSSAIFGVLVMYTIARVFFVSWLLD